MLGLLSLAVTQGQGALAQDRSSADASTGGAAQPAELRFDIAPQPLAAAVAAFGRQSGYQVSVDHGDLRGLASPGVRGAMTPDAALTRLLAGTGVIWRLSEPRSVVLTKRPSDSSGPLNLDAITVAGTTESAYGPVDGYRASRSATATKTDTPLADVPVSVQVVPRQVIEDQAALNLKDVYENVSSVQQAGNTLNAQSEVLPIIRGFESPTLLRNGLRSTAVGAVDLFNVERVEVLKGPASILYGALEPGGVVNYVTERPQMEAGNEADLWAGSYRFLRATADTTGPLNEDRTLAYRANVAYTNSRSFRDDIHLERVAFAPSLLWQPSADTELLVDGSYMHETQPYDTGIPLSSDGDRLVSIGTFFNDPDLEGRILDDYAIGYQFSHRFNPVWSLRNQVQFHRARAQNEALRPTGVGGPTGNELLGLRYQNEERRDDEVEVVLDATADFATGGLDHTLLLGGEFTWQDSDFRRFRQNAGAVAITDDPQVSFNPPANQPQQIILGTTRWAGLYAQDQLSLLDDGRLKLLLGGRYDVVRQTNETSGVSSPDVNERAFTGRVGLLYQVTAHLSPYASVSQSFVPQIPGTLDASGTALDPETGLQYEAGIKSSFLDDRFAVTASIYNIEKKNVAVFDSNLFNTTGQIAYFPGVRERSRGFEIDASGQLTDELEVIAYYSYTDTKVLQNDGDPTMVGEPLGGVPAHKARLWMAYSFGADSELDGFGLGGGARYVGSSTTQFDTSVKLDPYVVFDAAAWYRWNALKFSLNLNNLLNEDYIVRASNRAIAHPGEPFSAIAQVSVRF